MKTKGFIVLVAVVIMMSMVVSAQSCPGCSGCTLSCPMAPEYNGQTATPVAFVEGKDKIDVLIGGQHMTSYLFMGTLTKPVLYPVKTPSAVVLNRGFPLVKVDGETTDHPHHLGIFFTYDEVNDSGFWNNTTSPPQITHIKVTEMKGGPGKGTLATIMHWIDKNRKPILEEKRTMIFHAGQNAYAIDCMMDLTAKTKVEFGDTKEGMFAIRTADWLREKGGTGKYLSSNGDTSASTIWGKRAAWVTLEAKKDDKTVGIAIMNHPTSVNYPTFWHARDYGLFSANPLGQEVFEKSTKAPNPKKFGLELEPGEIAHFRFLVIIYDGNKTKEQLDAQFEKFSQQK
ncbi:MAG: PmoA family protein [Sedimentisphaerales bacterium]|nr:PmoA family protein [Sedimentisphaerales bacterium]